ncbi:MAG: hypothetical protein ABI131_09910 [Nostocoides sp.]
MATFTARKQSEATLPHDRSAVWDVLVDPTLVARMTPMVSGIHAAGDHWHWQLVTIPLLGRSFDLSFTEAMTFHPRSRIDFHHAPTGTERAGTDGTYLLADAGARRTRLTIDLAVTVDLPFPGLARPAIAASMQTVLGAMGIGFARSIERHLSTRR